MANYTSNAGFGYGLRVYGYNNGLPSDPYYDESPYFMQVFAQFFQTTLGQSYHRVELDMPFLAGSEYRLRSVVEYVGILNANFFGDSASDADQGLVGADGNVYDNLSDLTRHLESGEPGSSLRMFNNYQRRKLYGMVRVSRPVLDLIEVELGLEFGFVDITDWHNETDDFGGIEETFGPAIPIVRIKDIDEAIEVANGTAFGLSSGVCTNRLDYITRFIAELNHGTVNIWEVPGYRIEMSPFGGIKDSGLGYKEGVIEAMKSFTNVKTFSLPWQ